MKRILILVPINGVSIFETTVNGPFSFSCSSLVLFAPAAVRKLLGIHVPRKGRKNENRKKLQSTLTTIVTDEVTVSSPVSGGFSVTGGASSESALSIKK